MTRLPSLFVSHGAPTFAVEPGRVGPRLADLGRSLPRPAAVLVVSAHWLTRPLAVSTAPRMATIHDFGGFPRELHALEYPAPGDPARAMRAAELLAAAGFEVAADPRRGLDHGAWVPLLHLYPAADVPTFQVSLTPEHDPAGALAMGRALAPLAADGVLVVGSGSLTHNLHDVRFGSTAVAPYAAEFVDWIRAAVAAGDAARLARALDEAPHARRAHPTTEHFLPLLVAAGAAAPGAPVTVIDGGIEHAVLSMDAYLFGEPLAAA